MLDRASIFADPEIVRLLKTKFIPVAIDQAYQRRQKDAEGEFYRTIAGQGPRSNFKSTTQGLYVASADGTFLGYTNNRRPDGVKRLLARALDQFKPSDVAAIPAGRPDRKYVYSVPPGGLIIRVNSKVLGGYAKTKDAWKRIYQQSIGRDNLWTTRAEHDALVAGKIEQKLAHRLARFHLVDNTRGEPPMWHPDEVRSINLTLKNGRISGTVHLETRSGDRGYQADLYGIVEDDGARVTRFDLVAKGTFWGRGPFTGNAPKGKFPLAVAFRMADGRDVADAVPPQGSRGWVRGYIR